jgi:recombination protein RecT
MIDGREAALILFGNEARLMPMFQGLRTIAAKHGCSLRAEVVYAEDTFGYNLGLTPSLKHVPAALGTDRGLPIGAYAVAKHKTFGVFVEVMSVDEIERVRQISRASSKGPWVDWWPEMARKSVGRRLFKSLPLVADEQIRSMLEADDATNDLATNEPEVPADLSVPADAAFADFEPYDDTPVWDPADDLESEAEVGQDVPDSPAVESGTPDSTSPGVQPSFAEMAERAQQRGRKPAEPLEPELDNQ